jgi:hypothetical protein
MITIILLSDSIRSRLQASFHVFIIQIEIPTFFFDFLHHLTELSLPDEPGEGVVLHEIICTLHSIIKDGLGGSVGFQQTSNLLFNGEADIQLQIGEAMIGLVDAAEW